MPRKVDQYQGGPGPTLRNDKLDTARSKPLARIIIVEIDLVSPGSHGRLIECHIAESAAEQVVSLLLLWRRWRRVRKRRRIKLERMWLPWCESYPSFSVGTIGSLWMDRRYRKLHIVLNVLPVRQQVVVAYPEDGLVYPH